jgi:FkbM family methyltransferase
MNSFVWDALTRRGSHYAAVLPYNLNWMDLGPIAPLLAGGRAGPVTVVDIGVRGGLAPELHPIRGVVNLLGFDADEQECRRMNAEPHDLHHRKVFPVFVGAENGTSEFHLFRNPAESSSLRPDARFGRLIGGADFAIDRSLTVQTTTLDTFFQQHPGLPRADFIKVDTQGTELGVLRGAEACLRAASLVEVEVEFQPHYEGQPLFGDVSAFMRERGFELVYLNRVLLQHRGYHGFARGQVTFGDALFARREDCLQDLDDAAVERFLLLLVVFGHLDIAHTVLGARVLPRDAAERWTAYLQRRVGNGKLNRLRRMLTPWLDKLILLLLHARRHNALMMDSDRSWPVR